MRSSSPFTRDHSPFGRDPLPIPQRRRSISPNTYPSLSRSHTSSIKSQHLWQSLQQIQLFPPEFAQLLKFEQRNLNGFKKRIEREKLKVHQEFDSLKRQIIHNVEDLKLSVQAQLDRIYKIFLEKYAVFKTEILEIKRLRQQIEGDMHLKKMSPTSLKYPTNQKMSQKGSTVSIQSNTDLVKSMQTGQSQIRKYHVINYIAQLQKQKIYPLNDLCRDIIIMNEYDNGFFKLKQFTHLANNIKDNLRDNLRYTYQKKFQFIRQPELIVTKQQPGLLRQVYQQQAPLIRQVQRRQFTNPSKVGGQQGYQSQSQGFQGQAQQGYQGKTQQIFHNTFQQNLQRGQMVGNSQQVTTVQWCQDINLTYQGSLKTTQFRDIVLCGIELRRNQVAIGGKDGSLIVYDPTSGNRIVNLKGHKASICSLAIINHQGKKYLASGSDNGCNAIILWDTQNWTQKLRLEGHKAAVTCILDLNDGLHIASGSYDKKINVYNLKQGRLIYNLPTNKSSVTGIILSSRSTKMVSCGLDNSLNVWQISRTKQGLVQTMFLQRIIQNNTMICSFVGSLLQDHIMYIGTKDGKIKLINIQKGEAYKTLSCCNNAIIQMIIIQRQSKPDHPMAICWPGKQQCIKVVNCQNGKVTNVSMKGYIQFGCGIGPKGFILGTGRNLAMVSQSQDRKKIAFFRMDLAN